MYENVQKKILDLLKEKLVVRKSELIECVKEDVTGNPHTPESVVDAITKTFIQEKLVTPLYTAETTFAITQKGMRKT